MRTAGEGEREISVTNQDNLSLSTHAAAWVPVESDVASSHDCVVLTRRHLFSTHTQRERDTESVADIGGSKDLARREAPTHEYVYLAGSLEPEAHVGSSLRSILEPHVMCFPRNSRADRAGAKVAVPNQTADTHTHCTPLVVCVQLI